MGECWATVFATAISHQVLARMNHHVVECRWHDEEAGDKMRKRHGEELLKLQIEVSACRNGAHDMPRARGTGKLCLGLEKALDKDGGDDGREDDRSEGAPDPDQKTSDTRRVIDGWHALTVSRPAALAQLHRAARRAEKRREERRHACCDGAVALRGVSSSLALECSAPVAPDGACARTKPLVPGHQTLNTKSGWGCGARSHLKEEEEKPRVSTSPCASEAMTTTRSSPRTNKDQRAWLSPPRTARQTETRWR